MKIITTAASGYWPYWGGLVKLSLHDRQKHQIWHEGWLP